MVKSSINRTIRRSHLIKFQYNDPEEIKQISKNYTCIAK